MNESNQPKKGPHGQNLEWVIISIMEPGAGQDFKRARKQQKSPILQSSLRIDRQWQQHAFCA